MQTIGEIFASAARHYPDRTFLDDGSRAYTYREFEAEVCRLANVLTDLGVSRGQPVAIYMPNSIEIVLGYQACHRLGAVAMPLSSLNTAPELDGIARRTDFEYIITGDAGRDVATQVCTAVDTVHGVLDVDGDHEGTTDLRALMADADDRFALVHSDPESVATLFFTSGTTGAPKGIQQSHRSVFSTVRDMEVYNRFRAGREVLLSVLPMFNNFGATDVMVQATFNGGTVIIHERWNTERVLEDIRRYGVTFLATTPTMLTYMLKSFRPGEHDLSSLSMTITGGAPVAPRLIDDCRDILGIEVRQIYGSSEVCGNVAGEPLIGVRKRGSTGPSIGSARIVVVDEANKEVDTGIVGEVIVKGDTVSVGYWRDPQLNAEIFADGGWRSGDLGYLDDDGYLFVVDRKKDMIICGGFNIYPIELENVLYAHPAVKLVAVVGLPDDVLGEIPVAFVQPVDGADDDLAEQLDVHCRGQLAKNKLPRRFEILSSMPLGPSGKVLKRELRSMATSANN